MKKPFVKQENEIDWYVSYEPIEKYLKIDRMDNQTISKFVRINSEKHFYRKKLKLIFQAAEKLKSIT